MNTINLVIFLKQKKNAVVTDFQKNAIIYADEIKYLKNDEKIFTIGKTRALIENKYKFYSEDVSYFRIKFIFIFN